MYNKELFVVFEIFHTWCYYLKELESPINIIINYKNLEYFSTTKILSCHQDSQNFSFSSTSLSILSKIPKI